MILPDYLTNGLAVVFCGTAAGTKSAQRGHYYSGPGNKFWSTLTGINLLPNPYDYTRDAQAIKYGIGLTDLVKHHFGQDDVLKSDMFDRAGLEEKIQKYAPRYLAFTSKRAAKEYFQTSKVAYGLQQDTIASTKLFVLPSPSGLATRYWNINDWQELAESVRTKK